MNAHAQAPGADQLPPKPHFEPFTGLPDLAALSDLQARPQWVVWDYRLNGSGTKWTKPPLRADNGRNASHSDPSSWASYDSAADRAQRYSLPGVGFVLTDGDEVGGFDLDDCRDPATGALTPWAAQIIGFGETYAEVSPSRRGVRIFAKGKPDKAVKCDPAGIEVYSTQRFLTVTGRHITSTPAEIRPAPRTLAALLARVEAVNAQIEAEKEKIRAAAFTQAAGEQARTSMNFNRRPNEGAGREGGNFFRKVNSRAFANLDAWVPNLFGPAAKRNGLGYRISSRDLGRPLEEDLSITGQGGKDFGLHDQGDDKGGSRTAIDLVIEHGGAADAVQAALWLCERLGVDPASLGWGTRATGSGNRQTDAREQDRNDGNGARKESGPSAGRRDDKPKQDGQRHSHWWQGIPQPELRDRLEVAMALDPAPAFPVKSLPPLMGDMVRALVDHVQAPESLCAHSVISAATLAVQGLADVRVPSLPRAMPLSLFMLAIAASGERKSSCDGMALKAVSDLEARLRETYADEQRQYKAEHAAFEGEKLKIRNDKKLDKAERLQLLKQLIEPQEPTAPIMRAEEPNLEGLMNLLAHGRPSVGVFTSEGGSFLGGHGMSNEAKVRTLTGLSRLYDDGSGQRVRAKEITFLHGRRVSVSLAVQPRIAAGLLGDEMAKDQGFVGRFLVCMPDSNIGFREVREARSADDPRVATFHDRMARLLTLQENAEGELKLPALTFDPIAWAVWKATAQKIEDEVKYNGYWRPVLASANRAAENIARIAGVLHLFCFGHTDKSIEGETMAIACEVGLFYLKEALRLCNVSAVDPETVAVNDLASWLATREGDLISPTIVQQSAPNHLRKDARTTRERIASLCAAGILDLVEPCEIDGRRYREVYRFNRGGRH